MNDAALRTLLADLLEQTQDRRRRWDEVPDERDAFFTAFDAGTLGVRRKRTTFQGEDGDFVRVDQILVQIVTAEGDTVLERAFVGPAGYVRDAGGTPGFSVARDLWDAARETARGADELIKAILREVRGELQAAA